MGPARRLFRRIAVPVGCAGLLLAASGCAVVQGAAHTARSLVATVTGRRHDPQEAARKRAQIQHSVMRAADRYVARVSQTADDLIDSTTNTPGLRVAVTQWKLDQATAVYINASGDDPVLNAVDMVFIATVSRMIIEDHWVGERFGPAAQPLLEAHRTLETNSWYLVRRLITPDQTRELRDNIAKWRRRNPQVRSVAGISSGYFFDPTLANAPEADGSAPPGLLNVVGLDPLSRITPAVRSIEQSRYLAERSIYYAERLPKLLHWQAELFVFQMAEQPEFKQILTDSHRLTLSTESFAQTARQLPGVVNDQRTAALNQLFAGMAAERSNILATLSAEDTKARALLSETRATLDSGREMADSVDAAIKTLDAFVRSASNKGTNARAAPNTNRPPFDVRQYGIAADKIGGMAREVNTLLGSATQGMPAAAQLTQSAGADARAMLNHAFLLGVLWILILATALAVAGLIYRKVAARWPRP